MKAQQITNQTEWKKVKLKDVLKQYRNTHWVEDKHYKQVTISQTGEVSYRGTKHGSQIGRKRQFIIDLKNHPNTLIFIRQGVYKGGIGICPKEVDGCLVTENMPMFDIVGINPEYLIYYLKSPQFKEDIDKLVPLGTAQKAIHERQLLEIEIPLPSPKEQEEIVKRVKSNSHGISEINNINNKNENYIVKLRQQILQEAVQGRLVKQDPKDEPASVLLKKIKAEKDKLIKEGKIRKEKPLAPISEDEIPYDLPKGWEWCRWQDIMTDISYGFTRPMLHTEIGIPIITAKNVFNNRIDFINSDKTTLEAFDKLSLKDKPNRGDILLTKDGTLGRASIVDTDKPFCISQSVAIIWFGNLTVNKEYLIRVISSPLIQENIKEKTKVVGVPHISINAFKEMLLPIPPLTEQKRIVEKVDKLMTYCDGLEKQIKENQGNSEKLMVAVLKNDK